MKKEKLYKGKLFELNAYYMKVEHRKVRREVIEHPGAAAVSYTHLTLPTILLV